MANVLNFLINLLKFPVAILMVALTFKSFTILFELVVHIAHNYEAYKELMYGIFAYLVMWLLMFNIEEGQWFLTFEHELTHTIFALLTFHAITDFRVTKSSGGHMVAERGEGNWLIAIAPYFFPTFSILILIVIYLSKSSYHPLLIALLGYSIAYHLHSTIIETSLNQPDIKNGTGVAFAILFLPAANFLAYIAVLSSIPGDNIYFHHIFSYLYDYTTNIWHNFVLFISQLNH